MKTSSNYWQKRFQAVEAKNNQTAKGTVQSVTPAFDKAQAQIEKEINAWYGRFAKNNQISLQEAKKLLNTKELKEFRWDVKEYIKYGRQNALDQAWMKELENASARFHISRLEALKIRTQNAAEQAFGNELDQIDQMAARVYMDDYYHTAFEIQRGLGIGWDVSQIDERKLKNILSKPWTADKMTFSDRIWKSKTQLIDSLHKELTQMCVLGKAPDQAISAIAKRMNVSKGQAGRLVMTEAAYFGSAAQKDCFNDLDVEKFEVVATLDNRTSDVCQEMDGKVFDMKDFEAGVTAPPFHVWCRSCTAPWFPDDDDGMRAARNADGQTYYVPSNMKYDDWKNSFVNGGSKAGLTPVVDVEELKKLLADKQHELDDLKNKAKTVSDDHVEWKNGKNNPYYQKYDAMSDSEYKKYVQDLNDRDRDLCIELDKLKDDLDRYYDRPDRGTPERDIWDKWKKDNNIDLNALNNAYYIKEAKLRVIRNEFNETVGFNKWKTKFAGKTEQDFIDEIANLTFEQQDIQKQIDDLKKQIDDALKLEAEAAYNAKGLREIKDEIIKKHESILKTDIQKQELSDLLDGMDKERANLYNQMSVNFQPNQYYKKNAGWYSYGRQRVEMDLDSHPWDDSMGRNLQGAWKTKLHEEMHQLDHVLASRKTDFAALNDGSGYHYKFAFTHPDTVTGKKLIEAIDDDILNFINKAVDWDVSTNSAAVKRIKTLGRISSEAKEATIKYLKHRYPTAKDRARIDTLTDAIGLTTKANLHPYKHGFWGHDAGYTKDAGKRGATSEAWANLGAFFIRNDTEVLDALTEVMPKTVSAYKEVFDEVVEYAKTNALTYKP
jgi:SPP1 gp7 family putative phage head morphogenesis protein